MATLCGTPARTFATALAVRWMYAAALYALMGTPGLMMPDSVGYLEMGQRLAQNIGSLSGWEWLGPSPAQMPLFTWMLAGSALVFGAHAAAGFVLVQGMLDAGTCVVARAIAGSLDQRMEEPAALLAIVNPTMIVLSGLVLGDTAFVFLSALALLAAVRWIKSPDWRNAIFAGAALGLAALVRIPALVWAPVLAIYLGVVALARRQRAPAAFVQILAMALIAGCAVLPSIARNVTVHGTWQLTSQGGEHLARHVAPFVKEVADGTPRAATVANVDEARQRRFGNMPLDPFAQSDQYAAVGNEVLAQTGKMAAVKAWLLGAALNIATPAALISPPVAQLPRTGFSATPGETPMAKIHGFIFGPQNSLYVWVLIAAAAGTLVLRLLQACGLIALVPKRTQWPAVMLLVLWAAFFLAITGPISSPKYRLPIEPVLVVFAAAGVSALAGRRKASR